jgi:hypothetical protein
LPTNNCKRKQNIIIITAGSIKGIPAKKRKLSSPVHKNIRNRNPVFFLWLFKKTESRPRKKIKLNIK